MEHQENKPDKLTDKAFSRLMLTSVLGILACIVCLCSATWAWFSGSVTSDNNTLVSGHFSLDVTVTSTDVPGSDVTVVPEDGGKASCALAPGEYTVTLTMSTDTTVTRGFCTVKCGTDVYYTEPIVAGTATDPFTFTLKVEQANATVVFVSVWGIPSATDMINEAETLVIS